VASQGGQAEDALDNAKQRVVIAFDGADDAESDDRHSRTATSRSKDSSAAASLKLCQNAPVSADRV
jgi:hypothetical protein